MRFLACLSLILSVQACFARAIEFHDDFKATPDPRHWAFTFRNQGYGDGVTWLSGNGECQAYLTPLLHSISVPPALRYDPFSLQADGLHIKAALLSPQQQEAYKIGGFRRFGSGMLRSRFAFRYGRVRIIAKLPSARGSWPAFWLLPADNSWPPEIDMMEAMPWGKHPRQIHSGLIAVKGEKGNFGVWSDVKVDIAQGFHEYGLDWSADIITVLFDGKLLWRKPTPASMKQDMVLIINLAIGGRWVFNELGVRPVDGMSPARLKQGVKQIEKDYPAEMIVKSVRIVSP